MKCPIDPDEMLYGAPVEQPQKRERIGEREDKPEEVHRYGEL